MTINGGEHRFEGDYHIPGRLISGVHALHSTHNPCRLTATDDDVIAFTDDGTSMRMRLFELVPRFVVVEEHSTVEARVGFHELQRITQLLGELPMDATNFEKMATEPPVGTVSVEDGALIFTRLWRYMGCVDTHLRLAAQTTGTGSIDIGHIALRNHVNYLWELNSSDTRVRFDPDFGRYLTIDNEHFAIHLKRRVMGAARFFDSLKFFLKEQGLDFLISNDGVIAVSCGPVPVRMQFLDGKNPILRCSVTVLRDVEATKELLEELNSLNRTRVGIRVWIDGDLVVVGQDLRCDESTSYGALLDAVLDEAHYLGGVLTPMFGGTPNFTPDPHRP
jgi:hypothetical protein